MCFLRKILICIFTALILLINADYVLCSDNVQPEVLNQQVIEASPALEDEEIQANPVDQIDEEPQKDIISKESKATSESGQPAQESGESPILKMISALFKVLVLIIVLGIIAFLFKRFKEGKFGTGFSKQPKLSKSGDKKGESPKGEPSDVSEAVSSFIKHKLRNK